MFATMYCNRPILAAVSLNMYSVRSSSYTVLFTSKMRYASEAIQ